MQTITEEIRTRYDRDPRIPHAGEFAISERDGVVTLRGSAGSLRQIHAAVEVARSTPGVRDVANQITLDARDHWEDDELRGAVLRALISRPDAPDDAINVRVDAGWVTLKGQVAHQYQSDAAFDAAFKLPGVGGVTNEITVVTAGGH
jgi:osmotically-inducible protein OsmY